jgi:hypothetical protein
MPSPYCSRGNGQPQFISTSLQRPRQGFPSSETRSCNGFGRKLPIKPSYRAYQDCSQAKAVSCTSRELHCIPADCDRSSTLSDRSRSPCVTGSCYAMQRAWKCSLWLAVTAAGYDISSSRVSMSWMYNAIYRHQARNT